MSKLSKPVVTEFSIDFGLKGDRLAIDGVVPPLGAADRNNASRFFTEGALLATLPPLTDGWRVTPPAFADDPQRSTSDTDEGKDRQDAPSAPDNDFTPDLTPVIADEDGPGTAPATRADGHRVSAVPDEPREPDTVIRDHSAKDHDVADVGRPRVDVGKANVDPGKADADSAEPAPPTGNDADPYSGEMRLATSADTTVDTSVETSLLSQALVSTAATAPMMTTFAASSSTPTIFEARVATAGDDIEQRVSGGISSNVSDLDMGVDGTSAQILGLRYTGIDIPQGAIITSAYIQFAADEVETGAASLLIEGEDVDDAAAFANIKFNVSSRARTGASVAWDVAPWTTEGEAGLAQRTPDLSAIIQEIINRSGWAALNDIAFLISGTGTRTATSFEGNAATAPLLHIEYYLPTTSNPVVFNNPADVDGATNQIAELAIAGTKVGITASASDPDAGDTVSYSIDDTRFAIDANGVITRSNTGTLDFETATSITLTVTATSSDLSTATKTSTLNILNSPEPVAFNAPADTDSDPNRIAQNAAAGTEVGITASARDPDAGSTVTYSLNDARFVIDPTTGVITRSGTGTLNAQSEANITLTVTATSSDGSIDTESFNLGVTSGTSNQPPSSVTLVRTILTSQWSPASPDPSGIAYIPHLGTFLVSDGEVDEMSIFKGKNVFEMSPSGQLVGSRSTTGFSDEPTGVAYNPANRHLFYTDDTGTKSVYEVNPGADGLYHTSDDIVTSFKTSAFGSTDPEGIAYDTKRGVLYIADGVSDTIYTVKPGANGKFDGVPSVGGDDIVTSFSVGSLGINDPEGVEYDPAHDLLYVIASRTKVAMLTTTGQLLGMLDISAAGARNPAGLALAPSSGNPNEMSLYIVDRGVDNDSNPTENDGKVYEFHIDNWLLS